MLTSAGGLQGAAALQNDINAQIAKFQQAWQYPQQQLGMMESSLGMTPYNTGTSGSSASTTEQTQSNPVGAATSAMQMLGGLFSAPAGGTSAIAGLGALSDRRMKTDIKRVDTHATGLPIYAYYRYKERSETLPLKVVEADGGGRRQDCAACGFGRWGSRAGLRCICLPWMRWERAQPLPRRLGWRERSGCWPPPACPVACRRWPRPRAVARSACWGVAVVSRG